MGYPLPIVRYLTEQSHLIHKKKVLTLGNLYPSGGAIPKTGQTIPRTNKIRINTVLERLSSRLLESIESPSPRRRSLSRRRCNCKSQ